MTNIVRMICGWTTNIHVHVVSEQFLFFFIFVSHIHRAETFARIMHEALLGELGENSIFLAAVE